VTRRALSLAAVVAGGALARRRARTLAGMPGAEYAAGLAWSPDRARLAIRLWEI